MTVAVGVVVKAGGDCIIIYAEKLIDGRRRRREWIKDGTVSSGSSIPESIICVRPVVGGGIETDRRSMGCRRPGSAPIPENSLR